MITNRRVLLEGRVSLLHNWKSNISIYKKQVNKVMMIFKRFMIFDQSKKKTFTMSKIFYLCEKIISKRKIFP